MNAHSYSSVLATNHDLVIYLFIYISVFFSGLVTSPDTTLVEVNMTTGSATVTSYLFELNDGSGDEDVTTSSIAHHFLRSGLFLVQVTTTDQENNKESDSRVIKVPTTQS